MLPDALTWLETVSRPVGGRKHREPPWAENGHRRWRARRATDHPASRPLTRAQQALRTYQHRRDRSSPHRPCGEFTASVEPIARVRERIRKALAEAGIAKRLDEAVTALCLPS